MLREPIVDSRAWRRDQIGRADETCVLGLPARSVESLRDTARSCGADLARLRWDSAAPEWRDLQAEILASLESGRGFVILDRLPVERCSAAEVRAFYWLIGLALGLPMQQNLQGELLYDVRDTGRDVSEGVRFSITRAESSFHTDGAFNEDMPEYVGLLCLNKAKAGGRSQLVSAYSLHNEILATRPEMLETLYSPFLFDRRGQFLQGQKPYASHPIFHWDGSELTARYLHYYIQIGHEKAGRPLSGAQNRALDLLNAEIGRDDIQAQFDLQPGQMLFTNNRWILHNRTAFEDFERADRRRHYVRLWLRRLRTSG